MIVLVLVSKVRSLVLFFVGLFRRALCCFRRKRRLSQDDEPLVYVGVGSQSHGLNAGADDMSEWEWTDGEVKKAPSSVQEHIELYRQQQALAARKVEGEVDVKDLFEDMTPRITRQTKVLIGGGVREEKKISGLSLVADGVNFVS